jgi:hypothetical protein
MVIKKEFYAVAIDPLALILPPEIYEKIHRPRPPEPPLDAHKIVEKMEPMERELTLKRVNEVLSVVTPFQKELR